MLNAVEQATELRPGLWRWVAHHPTWQRDVANYLVTDDEDVALIDPLAPQGDAAAAFWEALDGAANAGRRITVLVTVPDHARSAPAIAGRYPGTPVHVATRRRRRSLEDVDTTPLEPSTPLPAGIRAFETSRADERALWIAPHRALFVGDALLGTSDGLKVCPEGWLPKRTTRATVAQALAALEPLDIDLVLPTHGDPPPDARAALREAIAEARGGRVR
ncbi:MAG: Metallo-beta-lactamase superfamily [Gaiellaceae bacterium]|nr:Metallo-beta-lactamase superfamily [Gaiellaceae bacterium]